MGTTKGFPRKWEKHPQQEGREVEPRRGPGRGVVVGGRWRGLWHAEPNSLDDCSFMLGISVFPVVHSKTLNDSDSEQKYLNASRVSYRAVVRLLNGVVAVGHFRPVNGFFLETLHHRKALFERDSAEQSLLVPLHAAATSTCKRLPRATWVGTAAMSSVWLLCEARASCQQLGALRSHPVHPPLQAASTAFPRLPVPPACSACTASSRSTWALAILRAQLTDPLRTHLQC